MVTNHDIGRHSQNGDPSALERRYDIVMASNVLNVQPSWAALAKTVADIAAATKPDGKAIVGYPRRPRVLQLTPDQIQLSLEVYFQNVTCTVDEETRVFVASNAR